MNNIIREDVENIIHSFNGWESFRKKTVLISGANGFLPAYLVETLLYLKHVYPGFPIKVLAMVRSLEKAEQRFSHLLTDSQLQIVQQDVSEPYNTTEEINFIIHAASQASPKYYSVDPVGTLNANVLGTNNMIKLAHEKKAISFLYFSSSEVYGEVPAESMPLSETTFGYLDPVKVRACYAESKRMGENICVSWHHQFGVKAKIVRPFHTYGPGMALSDGRVFADFVSDIVSGKDISLNSDGAAKRAFCYLADATRAFFTILLYGKDGEAYNMGNPAEEYSILQLAEVMITLRPDAGLKVLVNAGNTTGSGYLKSPVSRNSPNISKIKALGWIPETTVKKGFERTVLSFLE